MCGASRAAAEDCWWPKGWEYRKCLCQKSFPSRAKQFLHGQFSSSRKKTSDANNIKPCVTKIVSTGRFTSTKWMSSHPEVLDSSETSPPDVCGIEPGSQTRPGVRLGPEGRYNRGTKSHTKFVKRSSECWAGRAVIFDPLGIVAPLLSGVSYKDWSLHYVKFKNNMK